MALCFQSTSSNTSGANAVRRHFDAPKAPVTKLTREALCQFAQLLQYKKMAKMDDTALYNLVSEMAKGSVATDFTQDSIQSQLNKTDSDFDSASESGRSVNTFRSDSPSPSYTVSTAHSTVAPNMFPETYQSSSMQPVTVQPIQMQRLSATITYFQNALKALPHPSTFSYVPAKPAPRKNEYKAVPVTLTKGDFYIPPEMVERMMEECEETFEAPEPAKLAFSLFKEGVAMQCNDEQLFISRDFDGVPVIFMDLDLHRKGTSQKMYMEARQNDPEFAEKVQWKITALKTKCEIERDYGITKLPLSSRAMQQFQAELNYSPANMNSKQMEQMLNHANFHKLPAKSGKLRNKKVKMQKLRICEGELRQACWDTWLSSQTTFIPVVVVKGNAHWIEWKVPVHVGNGESIAISLRYFTENKKWRVVCMDYDHGRVYYQHRLLSLPRSSPFRYDWDFLKSRVTTALRIVR